MVNYVVVMGNTSLVLSDYIDEEQQLFDVLQLALINDSTNLYKLQKMFYPPRKVSPYTVVFNSTVTVDTILFPHNTSCGYENPAFKNSSDHYVRNIDATSIDQFSVSNDAFSDSQAKLTAYVNSITPLLVELESVSFYFILAVTSINMNSYSESPTRTYEYTLNLKVDKLDVMPCQYDYVEAMNSLLSWVSTAYYQR